MTNAVATTNDPMVKLIESMKPAMEVALPNHVTGDRMARIVLTCLRTTPKLMQCTPESLMGCIMEISRLGLEPGGFLGLSHLIPYKNVCTLIVGYKGLNDLAMRSGKLHSIMPRVVYEKDFFEYEFGLNERCAHKPAEGDRGKVTHYYCVADHKEGPKQFDVMSIDEVNAIRDKVYKWQEKPWKDHPVEMGKKTVDIRLCKRLQLSPELASAVSHDEMADAGLQNLKWADGVVVQENKQLAAETQEEKKPERSRHTADRKKMMDWFKSVEVTEDQILAFLELDSIKKVTAEHLTTLRGIAEQIQEGKEKAADVFPPAPEAEPDGE